MTSTFRLDRLTLSNFRCFSQCDIELHPELTVLVAENGRGKTAVLDAISISLGLFVDTVVGTQQMHGFDRADIRMTHNKGTAMVAELPTSFTATGTLGDTQISWTRAVTSYSTSSRSHIRTSTKNAESLRSAAQAYRDSTAINHIAHSGAQGNLPLVAFYGTGRLWNEHRLTEGKKVRDDNQHGRLSGYTDCLSSSSSFKGVTAWYEAAMNAVRDPKSRALPSEKRPENLIAAVREATAVTLAPTGWCTLDWDFEQRQLVVENTDYGRLPLSSLSDGIRTMIALTADIAYRCVSLNPHLGEEAARRTQGILLIDEVDMHLHPGWQQQVINLLRQAFPLLQIVVSTHSPHVLSTVDVKSVRVIHMRDTIGVLTTPDFQTRGVESADVLSAIMGVDPVPQVTEAEWLSDYRALIEDGLFESPEALELHVKLVAHFGLSHPVMAECDRLVRFQNFKVRRGRSEVE